MEVMNITSNEGKATHFFPDPNRLCGKIKSKKGID